MGQHSSGRRRAVKIMLAASMVAATGAVVTSAQPARAEPVPSGLTATPVLSARRLPAMIEGSIAAQRLSRSLAPIPPAVAAKGATGCLVVQQGGRTLYGWNPTTELIPASNEKLLTATAAVDRLGASRRSVTAVAGAHPVAGVVRGNLYLVGSGDPYLRTAGYASAFGTSEPLYTSLAALASDTRRAGVTKVTGSVVGDESRFDQLRTVPSWSPVYAAEGDVAPLSALDVNDGTAPAAPAGPTLSSAAASSKAALAAVASADPAIRAAETFAVLLRADGVTIAGPPATGRRPAGAPVLASIASATLGQELQQMLSVSDDTAAELFTKQLGLESSGTGSTAAGMAAIRVDLAADGLPVSGFVGADGSGLSRADRVSCDLLAADLDRLGPTSVVGRGLPVAGRTGTLADRMVHTAAAGRLVAKTGTLNNVVALSGFVLPTTHGQVVPGSALGLPLVFSIVLDRVPTVTAGRQLVDRVGILLAGYPRILPEALLEPHR
jgi:D-alanyl-D-alanine carboxypeptidase/D-alanyl-D-alanine-endopeptidase (penicillin-binding protein 4)